MQPTIEESVKHSRIILHLSRKDKNVIFLRFYAFINTELHITTPKVSKHYHSVEKTRVKMPLRKISKCQPILRDIIIKTCEILNISHVEFTVRLGSDDLDSFYNGMFDVEINGFKDGQKIKQAVIIKWHSDSEKYSGLREAYVREVAFYKNIIPKYLEIQNHFKVVEGLRIKFPNCIFSSDEYGKETIVGTNLMRYGYTTLSRFDVMDLNYVLIVTKHLAKMHALSFVLQKYASVEFEQIKKIYDKDVLHSDPNREYGPMRRCYDASVDVVSDPIAKLKLKEIAPQILSILHKSTLPVPEYSAICHGDCWNNNILYKNKGHRPVEVVLIDYQLSRYASPITDIAYFLYMSHTEENFLVDHYDSIMDIYYATLTAVLRECYLNVEEIYPKEIFRKHLEVYSVFGLVESLISMMIITAPTEETLKMAEIKDQFCDEGFVEVSCNYGFQTRVNNIVNHFFSKKYSLNAVLLK